jgi:hypothetical protein
MYKQRNNEARSGNQCCRGQAVSIMHSDSVPLNFFIQHAMRIRPIILSSVVSKALPYFPTFSHKRYGFRGKKLLKTKFVF